MATETGVDVTLVEHGRRLNVIDGAMVDIWKELRERSPMWVIGVTNAYAILLGAALATIGFLVRIGF